MKRDFGTKYVCFNCAAKFYDLGKPQAICPMCEIDQAKRPKKKEKKGFRNYDVEERPSIDLDEKVDLGEESDDAVLMEMETPELDVDVGDNSSIAMDDEEEDE